MIGWIINVSASNGGNSWDIISDNGGFSGDAPLMVEFEGVYAPESVEGPFRLRCFFPP
jgi:hypothetical protein